MGPGESLAPSATDAARVTPAKSAVCRTDLPGGNYETLLQSITGVLFPLGDDAVVHPGHGPDTTIRRERTTNPFVLEYVAGKHR